MKHCPTLFVVLLGLLLAACTSAPKNVTPTASLESASLTATQEKPAPTSTTPPAADPSLPEVQVGQPGHSGQIIVPLVYPEFSGKGLVFDRGDLFAGSGLCTGCHSAMTDATGKDVSLGRNWSATMMANSSKDPYWIATVRSEVDQAPEMGEVIEDKCSSCHMPMAFLTSQAKGEPTLMLDDGYISTSHPYHGLASDSISCNLCHQLEPDNFGTEESFSGGFAVDVELESGERKSTKRGLQQCTAIHRHQNVSLFRGLA